MVSFMMDKKYAFGYFNKINNLAEGQLIEISIKKSRIDFVLGEETILTTNTILGLLTDSFITEDHLIVTSFEDRIHLIYECGDIPLENIPEDSFFIGLMKLIEELGDHICQCPALEFAIAKDYIKVYIDKPAIDLQNLIDIKKVFKSNYSLELQKQRPYCLFIRDGLDD